MSDEKQPKKIEPTEKDQSDNSEETRQEPSPEDTEDKCLLPVPPSEGAESLPLPSTSGASASEGLTSLFRKISPFKSKSSSKVKEPPRKKSKDSKLKKAKKAFRKTFRRSDPIKGTDKETDEIRRRKYSDPTHSSARIHSEAEQVAPKTDAGAKPKRSLFGHFSGSSSKEDKEQKTKKESKTKEPKVEKDQKSKEVKPKKGFFGHSSEPATKPEACPEYTKKALSPRPSNQLSIGAVSVGFFNEALMSESSGNPTESTSLDIKSGSSYSPDAPSSRKPTIKRPRSSKESDEESSSD